jgi:hypothetical protein
VEIPMSREVYKCVYTQVKSVYIISKLVCILLAKWCVGIGNPIFWDQTAIYLLEAKRTLLCL